MVQVKREHYFKGYDDWPRFASYFEQIQAVKELKPKKILEIGVGNKTVSNYLKEQGYLVTTLDFDPALMPDQIGDVRKIPFGSNSFDLVLCCQVLEHLPFEEFENAINEMHRVSKRHVVFTVPFFGMYFQFSFNFSIPFVHLLKEFCFRVPYFLLRFSPMPQHFWEMGSKQTPQWKIQKIIGKKFTVLRAKPVKHNPYHAIFSLQKKPD